MKIRRSAFIAAVVVVVFALFSWTSSHALDLSDWNAKWFKTNFKVKSVCEDSGSFKLFKSAASAPTYIYLMDTTKAVIALQIDNEWVSTQVELEHLFGGADDGVYQTNIFTLSRTNGNDELTLYFIFRLTGKEKKGAFSSAKIASVAGYAQYNLDEDCAAALTFSGSYVITSKVPAAVQDLVN